MSRKVLGIVVALLALPLGYWAWQLILAQQLAARITQSRQNLKQIALALHSYHDQYQCFPPAYVLGPDGKPWHSWRVLLLPFLGEQTLAAKYRLDEPWDGPHNRQLQMLRPKVYASALQKSRSANVVTYLGVVSRRTMWPANFTVKIDDVTDGTSNTIFLVENEASDVVWSEPRDMREKDALAQLRPADKAKPNTPPSPTILILLVDGSVRRISPQINRDLFVSLLTPKFGAFMVADGWPREDRPASKLPDAVDISRFPGTRVFPVPEMVLAVNQTSLYCATVQLAWDLLRPSANAPVVVSGDSPAAESLNAHPFPPDALDGNSYFADAAGLDDDKSATLFQKLRERFPNVPVEMLGNPDDLPGIRILAYLQKSVPFPDVMEQFPVPLAFSNGQESRAVHSFGWPSSSGEGGGMQVLKETVEVRDYVSNDNFILVLHSDSPAGDEIYLAKVAPAETLQETWDSTASRLRVPLADKVVPELRAADHLQIPIISFGVVASLQELVNLGLPTAEKPLRFIADARQSMRFRLDEYGAELIADTQMVVGDNGDGALHIDTLLPRRLVFDRPFLLALKEKKATVPYFLAWIGNADLMELAKP